MKVRIINKNQNENISLNRKHGVNPQTIDVPLNRNESPMNNYWCNEIYKVLIPSDVSINMSVVILLLVKLVKYQCCQVYLPVFIPHDDDSVITNYYYTNGFFQLFTRLIV